MRPTNNLLQYRGSARESDIPPWRWWHPLRFPASLVLATIALMNGIFASSLIYMQFQSIASSASSSVRPPSIELTLLVAGVPLLFLLLLTSAITSKLAMAEHLPQWTKAEKFAVIVPQFAALVLPIAVIVVFGHPR